LLLLFNSSASTIQTRIFCHSPARQA